MKYLSTTLPLQAKMDLNRQKTFCFSSGIGLVLVILALFPIKLSASMEKRPWLFSSVKKRLVADGYNREKIDRIYASGTTSFSGKSISRYFTYREGKLDYDQFTSHKAIKRAGDYLKNHRDDLARAEKTYGVDKEIITAIMLVETRLGTYLGNSNVLNVLTTMASLNSHAIRDLLWRERLNSQKISRKKYDKKALKKARWAYDELKAFLSYTDKHDIDPSTITGSFAGAIGIAQFMPSNIMTLGKDGDGDGKVDLFTHADAIASIANYLKQHGWKPDINRKKAYKVVYQYNHSRRYVNTVLDVSELLKG